MSKPKIYVAGPWVFRPDAKHHAETLRAIAEKYGFEALIPLDNDCTNAYGIKSANRFMIEAADYIIADITPFRGVSADVGTAYEIGYAEALSIPCFLWSEDRSLYQDRVVPDGKMIESFGLQDNLMIICGLPGVAISFEAAVLTARCYDDNLG